MEKQKFRICSDLHSEFWRKENLWPELLPELETDKESILILAGDIGTNTTLNKQWFDEVVERFQDFVYINGNHEFYGSDINKSADDVVVRTFDAGKKKLVGATLWTDMNNANPLSMGLAQRGMSDYRVVRGNSPEHTVELNKQYVGYLRSVLMPGDVVVSHHPPTYRSMTPGFENSSLNPAFLNNLDDLIEEAQPGLWVHGHVHSSHDYLHFNTRIICNPYGYYKQDVNRLYNPTLVVDV
jgi:hypothetical protein